jgi:glycosyltransferase involved in cell wall biosynthesis
VNILYLCHQDNYHIRKWIPALNRQGLSIAVGTLKPGLPFNDGTASFPLLSRPLKRYTDFVQAVPAVKELIHRVKPDLLLASYGPGYGLTALLSGFRPFVVQTWSRDAELPGSLVSFTDHLLVKTVGRTVLRIADGITADGKYCAEVLSARFPKKATSIYATPWGIDLDFFKPSETLRKEARARLDITSGSTVLFAPRGTYWYYQPEKVLPALLHVLQHNERVFVLLPGLGHTTPGASRETLNTLIAHPRVRHFPDFLSPGQMRSLWAASDFFLSAPHFDGVSEAITEGRAMGSIPLLNRIGSNLERAIPGIHALYIDDTSANGLGSSILQALTAGPLILESIRKENLQWTGAFGSVNQTAAGLATFLRSVAESRHNYQT